LAEVTLHTQWGTTLLPFSIVCPVYGQNFKETFEKVEESSLPVDGLGFAKMKTSREWLRRCSLENAVTQARPE
jgi:hypothetical protein